MTDKEMADVSMTATVRNYPCHHKNGWYGYVSFWIFRREVFACSDCGEFLYGKKLRTWKAITRGIVETVWKI